MSAQITNILENVTQQFLNEIKMPNPNGKHLRYLLVMPCIAMNMNSAYRMPYGLCLVSSALKSSGRTVFTLNLNYKTNPYNLLCKTIIDNKIDVVLTGGLSGQYTVLKKILDSAKSTKSDIITCVGGGIVTADPIVAIKAFESADYGIIGEGEITVNAFAYALENDEDASQVAGVISSNCTLIVERHEISDLDILPFPDYDGFEFNELLRDDLLHHRVSFSDSGIPVAVGRSCPYNCTFCFHSSGKSYRRRSFESVRKELDWILNKYPTVDLIQFFDEMFSNDIEFLKNIMDYLKKRNLKCQIFQRVDSVTKDVLQLLKEGGCQYLFLGVESADDTILKSMRKNITVKQIENAFDMALEAGLNVRGNIIFGDLKETPKTIKNTLHWWKNHPEYNITIAWIFTFPGAHLYKVACERGIISDKVQYLKTGDMHINLTEISDVEYWKIVKKVSLFQILTISGADVDFDDMDDMVIALKDYLDNICKGNKIAIWPAKFDIIAMLNEISPKFISSENVFFVNVDPSSSYVTACERFGKQVFTPDEVLVSRDIEIVFFALGNKAIGDMVYNQICDEIKHHYPRIKRLLKITDCL